MGKAHFRIESTIRPEQEEKTGVFKILSTLGKLVGRSEKREEITTAYEYQGISQTERQYNILQITGSDVGDYELRIKVTDLNGGKATMKATGFRVIE